MILLVLPEVVNAAATLIPFPPAVVLLPPEQLVKTTGPLPVNAAAKFTPWLCCPEPPLHPRRVTVPSVIEDPKETVAVVPGDQMLVRAKP